MHSVATASSPKLKREWRFVNAHALTGSPLHGDSASAERGRVVDEGRRCDVVVHALLIVARPAVRRACREAVARLPPFMTLPLSEPMLGYLPNMLCLFPACIWSPWALGLLQIGVKVQLQHKTL